jgi:SPP1 gp7 family putative phage head morphogenesis protein
MSNEARSQLSQIEDQARKLLLREFRALHRRLQKRLQKLIDEITAKQSTGSVPTSFLFKKSRLQTILDDVSTEIRRIAKPNSAIISNAQADAVNLAETDAQRLLVSETFPGTIFRTNTDAVKELVGVTQNNTPLVKFLSQFSGPVARGVKNALIDGVATGQGARRIASRMSAAIGDATVRTLTTARTETNTAYRTATIEHYKSNSDLVQRYIWLSAKGLRTCIICWARHGKIYSLDKKPNSHPNCRCTIIPFLDESSRIPTGADEFAKLTDAEKTAILGKERFGLYQRGSTLDDFVGEKQTKIGRTPYVVPIAELTPRGIKKRT